MKNPESPIIFFEGKYSKEQIESYIKEKHLKVIDLYKDQSKELAQITNPYKGDKVASKKYIIQQVSDALESSDLKGDWIYFTWTDVLLHQVKKADYLQILTDRNIGLVSRVEQKKLLSKKIGIIGLSTGSSIALGLVHSGIGSHFTIADFDSIDSSDLNRTFYDLSDVGLPKVIAVARKMYLVNPYLEIQVFRKGLMQENSVEFLNSAVFDLFFDEASQSVPGIVMRNFARTNKIPVISMGNVGDGIYISIERYDQGEVEIYNGREKEKIEKFLFQDRSFDLESEDLNLIDYSSFDPEILKTVLNGNNELTEEPQLYSALALNSALGCFLARLIFTGGQTKREYYIKIPPLV